MQELNFVVYNTGSRKDCWWWTLNRKSCGTLPPECLAHSASNFHSEDAARNDVRCILANMPKATINGEAQ
jgi:hypothetical protein